MGREEDLLQERWFFSFVRTCSLVKVELGEGAQLSASAVTTQGLRWV